MVLILTILAILPLLAMIFMITVIRMLRGIRKARELQLSRVPLALSPEVRKLSDDYHDQVWLPLCTRIAVALAVSSSVLHADGCFIRSTTFSGQLVRSPRQEAVIFTDGEIVRVILRTHFERGPEDLAWIVPVPAMPADIAPSRNLVFTELEQRTCPAFYFARPKPAVFGCGCAAVPADSEEASTLEVHQTGVAGIFDYAVLSARNADDLARWLTENKFAVPPGSEPIIRRYVDRGFYWLAAKVRAQATDRPTLAPHPISFTYRSTRLEYPLVISLLSAAPQNEILLYVIREADCRYACANWSNAVITTDQLHEDPSSPSRTNYERLFADILTRDPHTFVTEMAHMMWLSREFSGELRRTPPPATETRMHITRLRTIIDRQAMDRDVILIPTQAAPVPNSHWIRNNSHPATPAAIPSGFALIACGTALRRRTRLRILAIPLIAAGLFAFCIV